MNAFDSVDNIVEHLGTREEEVQNVLKSYSDGFTVDELADELLNQLDLTILMLDNAFKKPHLAKRFIEKLEAFNYGKNHELRKNPDIPMVQYRFRDGKEPEGRSLSHFSLYGYRFGSEVFVVQQAYFKLSNAKTRKNYPDWPEF